MFHTYSVLDLIIPERIANNPGREEHRSVIAAVHAPTRQHVASLAHVLSLLNVDDRINPCTHRHNYDTEQPTYRCFLSSCFSPSRGPDSFGTRSTEGYTHGNAGRKYQHRHCEPSEILNLMGIEGQPMALTSVWLMLAGEQAVISS